MAHYIDKDALVAEIERRIHDYAEEAKTVSTFNARLSTIDSALIVECGDILSFINTLEVKEVDLEKHLKEDIEDVFFDLNGVAVKGATHYLTVEDVKDVAKHFYELGLKAQKGE